MDLVKNEDVIRLIERSCYHYHLNIANRVLRPLILQLYLDKRTWNLVETYTEKLELYRHRGYPFEELYKQIAACARFVETVHNGIYSIKNKVKMEGNTSDKAYRVMTVNNLPNNLKTFANLLNDLYKLLIELEEKAGHNPPVYMMLQEMESVSRALTKN